MGGYWFLLVSRIELEFLLNDSLQILSEIGLKIGILFIQIKGITVSLDGLYVDVVLTQVWIWIGEEDLKIFMHGYLLIPIKIKWK